MNGPVILNNVRQQLADEIFTYREPKPSPLRISPWLAMSLLQKAIRRREIEHAQRAAATLLLIAPERLWRRCGAAAFEEIGVADLQSVSLVTAALAGKKYRATIGGEWKVASFIVDRMAKAAKCRAADDLLLTADIHRRYQRAHAELAEKTAAVLIRIVLGHAAPPVRERVQAAGINAKDYSGHSLRAGLATSAAQAGVPTWKIRQQTGHASDALLARYIRDGELFKGNAAGVLL